VAFLDHSGKGRKSDIIGVNIKTNSIVIIEFKDSINKKDMAVSQLLEYKQFYNAFKTEYDKYFTSQLNSMGFLYNIPEITTITVNGNTTELYFGFPIAGSASFTKIRQIPV
jgi:hypothetical protein